MPTNNAFQQVDRDALNLTRSIALAESGGPNGRPNYTAIGDANTSAGAYQWNNGKTALSKGGVPVNFQAAAKEAGLNPLDFSPENQDKVAYYQVKKKKDEGLQPWEIAAWWNSGNAKNWEGHKGTVTINGKQVNYDTPAYVAKVKSLYLQQQQGQQPSFAPNPNLQGVPGQSAENPSLVQDLSSTASNSARKFVEAFDPTIERGLSGLPSTILQGGGAVIGGLGEAATDVLHHVPVVGSVLKGAEGLIGKGVGALAETDVGKSIANSYGQLPEEVRKDISGAFDIATAIPILRGLKLATTAAKGAAVNAVKGTVVKGAEKEITGALTAKATKGLVAAEARGVKPLSVLTKNPEFLPQVVEQNGRFVYNVDDAARAINTALDAEENALQTALGQAIKKNVMVDLEATRKRVLKDVGKEYQLSGSHNAALKAVNDYFDSVMASSPKGRTFIDLNELNGIKRDVREAVNFDNLGTQRGAVRFQIGQSLMNQVEEIAKKAGVKDIDVINKSMGAKLEALKILKAIGGKPVKNAGTIGREIATDVAGAGGEALGNMMGIPLASTFAGRSLARVVGKRIPRTSVGLLQTAKAPTRTLKKGLIRLGAGLAGQATTQPQSSQ